MALTWNLKGIENCNAVCFYKDEDGEERLLGRTETLVWATMFVGMSEITEKNAAEFFARVSLFEKINGALRRQLLDGECVDLLITPEDIRLHIGLKTNASNETQAAWLKRICTRTLSEGKDAFNASKGGAA